MSGFKPFIFMHLAIALAPRPSFGMVSAGDFHAEDAEEQSEDAEERAGSSASSVFILRADFCLVGDLRRLSGSGMPPWGINAHQGRAAADPDERAAADGGTEREAR